MLAPMMMGMAPRKEIEPDATSATTIDVVAELLCKMAATNNPINKPMKGLVVASRIVSAAVLPKYCSDEIIRSSAKKNMRSAPIM